ncbi:hypothetical protein T4B_10148 [Trichinella pseudospiralis]|uniref:Uncharacterized protein n=1 Tax=Trichinella pseudospiralis TaxID=6337 RepID=A0A0V1H4X4_TRIPS|nr:hypothetical protein T4B_10148 [Trichinella pseudospiralis]
MTAEMELNKKCPFGEGNNYQSAAYDSKFIQFTRQASQTACCNGTDSSEGTSLPSSDQNFEAESRSELKTSSAGIHLSSIEGRASIRTCWSYLMNAMKVKGLNGLNGLISLGVTWSSPDPYRYVMFIFNFSAVSCKEAVEVIMGSPLMGQFWKMEAVWMLPSTEEIKSEPVLLRLTRVGFTLSCPIFLAMRPIRQHAKGHGKVKSLTD